MMGFACYISVYLVKRHFVWYYNSVIVTLNYFLKHYSLRHNLQARGDRAFILDRSVAFNETFPLVSQDCTWQFRLNDWRFTSPSACRYMSDIHESIQVLLNLLTTLVVFVTVVCGEPPDVSFSSKVVYGLETGDNVTYTCSSGYAIAGQSVNLASATCQSDGSWTGVPSCVGNSILSFKKISIRRYKSLLQY